MTDLARPRSRLITRLIVAEALARPGQGPLARRGWPAFGPAPVRAARAAATEPRRMAEPTSSEPSEPRDD